MTFFPDPIRPSDGRKEDEIRVNPIEADKQGREGQEYKEIEKKRGYSILYGAFLVLIDKLTVEFSAPQSESIELSAQDELAAAVQELKLIFHKLMEKDQSENSLFCQQFSEVWHRLLQNIQIQSHTRRISLINLEKLKSLLNDIDHYPPNEDHKLGYYLAEYAGEKWLPFPFRDILRQLYLDHHINKSNSILSKWSLLIQTLIPE